MNYFRLMLAEQQKKEKKKIRKTYKTIEKFIIEIKFFVLKDEINLKKNKKILIKAIRSCHLKN